jgi:hypothetical protein
MQGGRVEASLISQSPRARGACKRVFAYPFSLSVVATVIDPLPTYPKARRRRYDASKCLEVLRGKQQKI